MRPFEGLRVIDLTHVLAGPFATHQLCMMGAEVIKIEKPGEGDWITTYANGGHIYAVIAGLRLDTSQTAGDGPGWSKTALRQSGFAVRHPAGL